MKCFACGYEYDGIKKEINIDDRVCVKYTELPFIELRGIERAPFHTELYSIDPNTAMVVPFCKNSHLSAYQEIKGTPATLYACPNCGTVKMDIGC